MSDENTPYDDHGTEKVQSIEKTGDLLQEVVLILVFFSSCFFLVNLRMTRKLQSAF